MLKGRLIFSAHHMYDAFCPLGECFTDGVVQCLRKGNTLYRFTDGLIRVAKGKISHAVHHQGADAKMGATGT